MTTKQTLLNSIDELYSIRNTVNRELTDNDIKIIKSDVLELKKQVRYVNEKINKLYQGSAGGK